MKDRFSILRLSVLLTIVLAAFAPQGTNYANQLESGQIIVNPTTGLETSEFGGDATFTVVLDRSPDFAVKIWLSSSDPSEGSVSPTYVDFRWDNWEEPQTVTITGLDDNLTDGDIPYTVITSPAISQDPQFSGVDPANVEDIKNLDNEGGPIANEDTSVVNKGQTTPIDVLSNDAALNSPPDTYTLTIVSGPDNGSAEVSPENNINYTPETGFLGTDTFDYKVCDERPRCSSATVNLTIVNQPPVAVDDSFSMSQNTSLSGSQSGNPPGVLDNDTDGDQDPLTAILVTGPTNGTLDLKSNGSFIYTPAQDFIGTDTFNYKANDGITASSVATATIQVRDTLAPLLEWASPSTNREVYQVGKEIITLQVNVSDNSSVKQVKFFRWDPIDVRYVDIDTATSPPFKVNLDTSQLVPGWNQVFARAYDAAGNPSDAEYIWLFLSIQVYLPMVFP